MAYIKALTLNCGMLPDLPGLPLLGNDKTRARIITNEVKRLKIDILFLNEVFSPTMRGVMIRELKRDYYFPSGTRMEFFPEERMNSGSSEEHLVKLKSINSFYSYELKKSEIKDKTELKSLIRELKFDRAMVNSGLMVAFRRSAKILKGSTNFTEWKEKSFLHGFTNMGFFHMPIGLKELSKPQTIEIIGLHMNPFAKHKDIRKKQFIQLRDYIKGVDGTASKPRPKLIMGDFNVIGETMEYRDTIGGNILPYCTDLFTHLHPHKNGFTWAKENPLTGYSEDGGKNERLDYALLVKDPKKTKHYKFDFRQVRVEKFENAEFKHKYASDHYGILVEFDIQKN